MNPFCWNSKLMILLHQRRQVRSNGLMLRSLSIVPMLAAAIALTGCSDNSNPSTPTGPTPVAVTETFTGTLNPNGGTTFQFTVQQTGAVTATLSAVSPDGSTIGLSLGTWNGQVCSIPTLANDNAAQGTTITGTAASTGIFCARVYDVGKLTNPVDFQVDVTHF